MLIVKRKSPVRKRRDSSSLLFVIDRWTHSLLLGSVQALTHTTSTRHDVVDVVESRLFVPAFTGHTVEHVCWAHATVDSTGKDVNVWMIGRHLADELRRDDETHDNERGTESTILLLVQRDRITHGPTSCAHGVWNENELASHITVDLVSRALNMRHSTSCLVGHALHHENIHAHARITESGREDLLQPVAWNSTSAHHICNDDSTGRRLDDRTGEHCLVSNQLMHRRSHRNRLLMKNGTVFNHCLHELRIGSSHQVAKPRHDRILTGHFREHSEQVGRCRNPQRTPTFPMVLMRDVIQIDVKIQIPMWISVHVYLPTTVECGFVLERDYQKKYITSTYSLKQKTSTRHCRMEASSLLSSCVMPTSPRADETARAGTVANTHA